MLYKHITASGAVNVYQGLVKKAIVTVNGAITGTLTISDETGTTGSPVVAIVTNPTVGTQYVYGGLTTGFTINPSTTVDITVTLDISPSGASGF